MLFLVLTRTVCVEPLLSNQEGVRVELSEFDGFLDIRRKILKQSLNVDLFLQSVVHQGLIEESGEAVALPTRGRIVFVGVTAFFELIAFLNDGNNEIFPLLVCLQFSPIDELGKNRKKTILVLFVGLLCHNDVITKRSIYCTINGRFLQLPNRSGGSRTHTVTILSRLSLPLDYTPKNLKSRKNGGVFFPTFW